MLEVVDIRNLQPGMVIVRVTQQNGPVKIKKNGLVTSQDMVLGLVEMGVQQVQIDTDQTVEIRPAKVKKSPTRKILENNQINNSQPAQSAPDVFQRNLFVPSVQDIPSAWLYYTKRYTLAGFIVCGGLSLGWAMANYQQLAPLISAAIDEPEVVVIADTIVQPTTQSTDLIEAEKPHQVVPDTTFEAEALSAPTTNQLPAKQPQAEIPPDNPVNNETASNGSTEQETPLISAGLLQKFQQAIAEVPEDPTSTQKVVEPSEKDVPRIDQLPAWIMTRLPSMAFSAHMYASDDAERWVRVNGTRMMEGDTIDGLIDIVKIEPQHVILSYDGQKFSMAALTDW